MNVQNPKDWVGQGEASHPGLAWGFLEVKKKKN